MNLASALTGGFAVDMNIQQSTINLGNQLMFMGIVIFEIPCNMALQRVSVNHISFAICMYIYAHADHGPCYSWARESG